jgi:Activator of Hsp90 ATPase homolog 1-like protein
VTEPLRMSFEVACPPEHAFEVWTSDIDTWWPPDHTVTGQADLTVVLQPGVGGRIYERTSDGTEHDWGEVTVWDPPTRLGYRWHLRQAEADATEVVIDFVAQGEGATRVDIEHRGWERLGLAGQQRRQTNRNGWESVLPHFVAAVEKGEGR